MKRKYWLIGAVLVGLLVIGLIWFFVYRVTWETLVVDQPKLSLEYPEFFNQTALSAEDTENKIAARLVNESERLDTPVLVSIRYEEGLRSVAALTRQDIVDMLLANANRAYPDRFNDYSKVTERKFDLAGREAAELVFTYTGTDGTAVKQRFVIIDIDGNVAVYLAAQTKASDFETINAAYFERMITSLSFD